MPKAAARFPKRTFGSVIELQLSPNIKKVSKPKKHFAYEVAVTWTDSTARTVYRSFDDVFEFFNTLVAMGALDIPKLTGRKTFERSTTQNFALKHLSRVREFVEYLLQLPAYIQQGDLFIWFWEPRSEDMIVETPQYGLPPARLLQQSVIVDEKEDQQDYICICTALAPFDGDMGDEYAGDRKGLPIKDGDVIYVLGMSDCPTGFWMVRNVFGSEGYVPIVNVRVDQDILQRKKLRMSRRLSASQRLNSAKSAENLSRTRRSCSVMDLQRKVPSHLGSTFSPTLERSHLASRNPEMSFIEPSSRPYNLRTRRAPHYSGNTSSYNPAPLAAPATAYNASYGPSGYNGNRSQWQQEESLTSYNNAMDRRETDDLIRTLHETSMMLQERMVRSEHTTYQKSQFDEIISATRPATRQSIAPTTRQSIAQPVRQSMAAPHRTQGINQPRQSIAQPRQSGNFTRSPAKRVRVSGRFKRMSPSPSKLLSPCRRGIGKLRIQPKSPLAAESPSRIVALDQSPLSSGAKRSPAPLATTPNKKSCVEEEDKENAVKGEEVEEADTDSGVVSCESKVEEPKKRRSEVARRVSMRLKQVFNSPARTQRTARRQRTTPKKV